MWRLFGEFLFPIKIPSHSQNWQPKAPTLTPQLPDCGKNTDKLLME